MHTREDAMKLLIENTPSDSLRRHCMAVEACMRFYAERLGEDAESWGNAGLLHDFDYEMHPVEHPLWGIRLLESQGWSTEIRDAIAAHYSERTKVVPETPIQRHLFACDEITGLITAVAYVRPSKSVLDVELASVMKKFRTPAFAAGVSREDVAHGAELIGVPLEQHVSHCLDAMKGSADALGLK